jgi:21S rRNA (uridine2791-2'-O)-methyltransferase
VNRTNPEGRVIGIDLIPAQPPRGVSTIQGNFLSAAIQDEVRAYVREPSLGRMRRQTMSEQIEGLTDEEVDEMERGYIDIERQAHLGGADVAPNTAPAKGAAKLPLKERDLQHGRVVDVVLSDMSEPWDQTVGFYKKSLSDPYSRMMNTSGNGFRDHAGSMVRMRVVLCCFVLFCVVLCCFVLFCVVLCCFVLFCVVLCCFVLFCCCCC